MALHPTTVTPLSVGVHALALACLPIAFYGALVLSQRLDALGALVTYGFAVAAVMNAAVYSGFVAPKVAGQLPDLLRYTWYQNQAFALVYVIASCVAIALWSVALLRQARALGIAGLVLAPLIALVVLTHTIGLDVHGFGAITLAEAAWFIGCGIWLLRG